MSPGHPGTHTSLHDNQLNLFGKKDLLNLTGIEISDNKLMKLIKRKGLRIEYYFEILS